MAKVLVSGLEVSVFEPNSSNYVHFTLGKGMNPLFIPRIHNIAWFWHYITHEG